MGISALRWLLFVVSLGFLAKSVVGSATALSVSGFFASGLGWYWLGWKKSRSLDSPKPR